MFLELYGFHPLSYFLPTDIVLSGTASTKYRADNCRDLI